MNIIFRLLRISSNRKFFDALNQQEEYILYIWYIVYYYIAYIIQPIQIGDLAYIFTTGAYTETYSSYYFNGFSPLKSIVM